MKFYVTTLCLNEVQSGTDNSFNKIDDQKSYYLMMVLTYKIKNTPLLIRFKVEQIGFSIYLDLHLHPMMLICIRLLGYRYRSDSQISDIMRNPMFTTTHTQKKTMKINKTCLSPINRLLEINISIDMAKDSSLFVLPHLFIGHRLLEFIHYIVKSFFL